MILFILLNISLLFLLYVFVSLREKSFFNVLTYSFIIFVPANYILPIFYNYNVEIVELSINYIYVYVTYFIVFFFFFVSYSFNYNLPVLKIKNPSIYYYGSKLKFFSFLFFLLSFLFYLPVLIEFKDLILSPREIYTATRDGYGHYYFSSLLLLNLGLVLSFFAFKGFRLFLFFIAYVILAYLHGSKSLMIWGVFSYILFVVYFKNILISFSNFFVLFLIFSFFMVVIFFISSIGIDNVSDVFILMAGYSDYTRNAVYLIDNYDKYFSGYYFGLLQFQDEFFSRIPRFVYPDKPRTFGSLVLSQQLFPDSFALNVGDVSFGIVGVVFADFGYLSVFYLIIVSIVKGVLLRWSVNAFKETKNIFYFIMLLFFSGLPVLFLGLGYLVFEHVILSFFIVFLLSIKFKKP